MKRFADKVHGYKGSNPFSDNQARNFSDTKISKEFYPISGFWSLFNDQHEVLLGTRGCGKTFLLKMMRYSMLKKINTPESLKLTKNKDYIGLYVPMHLEYVAQFSNSKFEESLQISLFQIAFNVLLAQSLLTELEELVKDEVDEIKRCKKISRLVRSINEIWFNEDNSEIYEISELRKKLNRLYYNINWVKPNIENIPIIFQRQICSSLASVKAEIMHILDWDEEPTWIVCIDEAEFLNIPSLKCINTLFRSDSNRIALKIATLPYFHKTLETLDQNISVVDGNDFTYRVVDLDFNSKDFINLTNALCKHRLSNRFDQNCTCQSLEDFLGTIGNDDQIDYYRNEFGEKKSTREYIQEDIIKNFSEKRKRNAVNYTYKRKTIYDKFAPIYFVREMYKRSKKGNSRPGWYAGGQMIRKISQGNPRLYIQIMNQLFETAKMTKLEPKCQSDVILKFSNSFCNSTKSLERLGPTIDKELEKIAKYLHHKTHNEGLIPIGNSFIFKYENEKDMEKCKDWIQLAVAYARIFVSEEAKINGITEETKFLLANTYAAKYWLPMRSDSPHKISTSPNFKNSYFVEQNKVDDTMYQMTLLEEDKKWLNY